MKVLVTGAAGFIGSNTCMKLIMEGCEVVALDNFNDYYAVSLKNARVKSLLNPLGLGVKNIDVSNTEQMSKVISTEAPDVILHLAAQAGVRLPINQIGKYVQSNLVGFSNVLQAAIANEIPDFLYASSSSVYGNSENYPYSEKDFTLRPVSFYGATKMANELLVPTLIRNSSTRARALRFFTVYGPWGRPDMAYFRLISAAINKSEFKLFGDGSAIRDFTYIDDVANSIHQLVNDLSKRSLGFHDIVNIAGGKPASLQEMITEISSQMKTQIKIEKLDVHNNDVKLTSADLTYLKSLIVKIPQTSLSQGLSKVISWAKDTNIELALGDWTDSCG